MLSIALSSLALFAEAPGPELASDPAFASDTAAVAPARQSRAMVRIVKPVRVRFRPDRAVADRPAQLRLGKWSEGAVERPAIFLEFS